MRRACSNSLRRRERPDLSGCSWIRDDTRSLPRATVRHGEAVYGKPQVVDDRPGRMSLGMHSPVSSAGSADFLPAQLLPVMYMVSVPANSAYFMNYTVLLLTISVSNLCHVFLT